MTPAAFAAVRAEYGVNAAWWVWPDDAGPSATPEGVKAAIAAAAAAAAKRHVPLFYALRYSTTARDVAAPVYVCPEFWCASDSCRKPLLPAEVAAVTTVRALKPAGQAHVQPKAAGACPFCLGGPADHATGLQLGAGPMRFTVLRRRVDAGAVPFLPSFIETEHPDDASFRMPCCFGAVRAAERLPVQPENAASDAAATTAAVRRVLATPVSALPRVLQPGLAVLAPGKVGRLPPALAEQLTAGVNVVPLRIGVDNAPARRGQAFLAALAVATTEGSAAALLAMLLHVPLSTLCGALGGALVLEYYQDRDPKPSFAEHAAFVATLAAPLPAVTATTPLACGAMRAGVDRLRSAVRTFRARLADAAAPVDWPVVAALVALPGVLSPRGLHVVVIDVAGDAPRLLPPPGGAGGVAPPCDAPAVVLLHHSGTRAWEPVGVPDAHGRLCFQWPATGVGAPLISVLRSLPCPAASSVTGLALSAVLRDAPMPPAAALRDVYNRLTGLVFVGTAPAPAPAPAPAVLDKATTCAGGDVVTGEGAGVFVPVDDDGAILPLHVGTLYTRASLAAAPLPVVCNFYATHAAWLAPLHLVADVDGGTGLRTNRGLRIPVAEDVVGADVDTELFVGDDDMSTASATASPSSGDGRGSDVGSSATVEEVAAAIAWARAALAERCAHDPGVRDEVRTLAALGTPALSDRDRELLLHAAKVAMERFVADVTVTVGDGGTDVRGDRGYEACTGLCAWVSARRSGRLVIPRTGPRGVPLRTYVAVALAHELVRDTRCATALLDATVPRWPPVTAVLFADSDAGGELVVPRARLSWADEVTRVWAASTGRAAPRLRTRDFWGSHALGVPPPLDAT